MKFVVYDYDFAGTNDFLGQVVLCDRQKIDSLLSVGELVTLPLKDKAIRKNQKFPVILPSELLGLKKIYKKAQRMKQ